MNYQYPDPPPAPSQDEGQIRQTMMWGVPEPTTPAVNGTAATGPARSWCDPTAFDDIVGVDVGKSSLWLARASTGETWKCQVEQAFDEVLRLPGGTLVVGESAHLATPHNGHSLSQPFKAEQLLDFYATVERAGITLRLIPHGISWKMRSWSASNAPAALGILADKGTDANDALAFAYYVANKNGVSLAKPPQSFERCWGREYGAAVVGMSNAVLKVASSGREDGYAGEKHPLIGEIAAEVLRGGSWWFLSDQKYAFTVASYVITELVPGGAVFARQGIDVPGWSFFSKNVLKMSDHHFRGGVGRAKLMRDRLRPFANEVAKRDYGVELSIGQNKYQPWGELDARQEAAVLDAKKIARDEIREAYRRITKAAAGLPRVDPFKL